MEKLRFFSSSIKKHLPLAIEQRIASLTAGKHVYDNMVVKVSAVTWKKLSLVAK